MNYLLLRVAHIAAVAAWISGMLAQAIAIRRLGQASTGSPSWLPKMITLDRLVTTPAMFLVWALGLTLAVRGHWFPAPWLLLKLTIVVALSALHGTLAGTVRRISRDPSLPIAAPLGQADILIVLAVVAALTLALNKPF